MSIFRKASIFLLSAACIFAAACGRYGIGPTGTGSAVEQKVDQVFAVFDQPGSPGCALGVVRDGNFIYKKGYGEGSLELGVPITPESVFYMGSVSKQFTAASVVLAAEQGYLSLDDDIRKYVPEIPPYGKTITLREMLHHTSGLRDVLGLLLLAGRNFEDIHPTPELLDLLSRQKELNYAPGDEYLYSNTNFFLMSVVIRRATGKALSQFAEENIFKPLGMTHTRFYDDHTVVVPGRVAAYEPLATGGYRVDWSTNFDKVGDGGLMSSVDDLLLWDRNFYNNKLGKGTLLKELQTRGILNNGKQIDYALGLNISTYRGLPIVEHGGALFGYRTELLRFPEQKFSVITLCNEGTSSPGNLSYKVADLYLANQFKQETPASIAPNVDARSLAGLYRNAESHAVLELKAANGGLETQGAHFTPRDATHFVTPSSLEISFAGQGNAATRFTLNAKDVEPQVYEKYEPIAVSEKDLAQYAGEYTSAELQVTYRFAVKDGKLTLAMDWQEPAVLEPTVRDEFKGPFGAAIVFKRAAGRITDCDLFAGRVRNIAFLRSTPKTAHAM